MRLLLKILAVVSGLLGVSQALGSLMILGYFAFRTYSEGFPHEAKNLMVGYLALVTLLGGLGYYFLRTAWKHLRRPDRRAAEQVFGAACFVLGMWLLSVVSRHAVAPKPTQIQDPTLYLALELGVIVGCYLFYRLVLKRLAARTFPGGDNEGTSTAT